MQTKIEELYKVLALDPDKLLHSTRPGKLPQLRNKPTSEKKLSAVLHELDSRFSEHGIAMGACTKNWTKGTLAYRCHSCQTSPTSSLCTECFQVPLSANSLALSVYIKLLLGHNPSQSGPSFDFLLRPWPSLYSSWWNGCEAGLT